MLWFLAVAAKRGFVVETYTDGFDGLPVPSPDGRQLAWTSSRAGSREGQIYLATWNHQNALAALKAAPARKGKS